MPPAKARASAAHDDKFDDPSTAKKLIQSAVVGRGRRPAAAANHTSAGKESSSGIRPDRTAQTNGKIAHKSSRSSQVSLDDGRHSPSARRPPMGQSKAMPAGETKEGKSYVY